VCTSFGTAVVLPNLKSVLDNSDMAHVPVSVNRTPEKKNVSSKEGFGIYFSNIKLTRRASLGIDIPSDDERQ
jgi:hypothetical protein